MERIVNSLPAVFSTLAAVDDANARLLRSLVTRMSPSCLLVCLLGNSLESCVSPLDLRTGEFRMSLFFQTCKEKAYYYSGISYLPSILDPVSEMLAQKPEWE